MTGIQVESNQCLKKVHLILLWLKCVKENLLKGKLKVEMLSFLNLLLQLCHFITPSSLQTLNQRYFLHFKQRHCWGFCRGTCCSRADFCPRSSSWWRWLSPPAASWTFPWRPSLASRWSAHRDTCPGRAAGTERDDTGHSACKRSAGKRRTFKQRKALEK